MDQLKRAYEAIEMLKALDLPVSEDQLRGVAKLEKAYLQEEVIPLLKQEMEPMVAKLKGKFHMEVSYNKDTGLAMTLVDNTDRAYSSPNDFETSSRDTTKYSIDGGEPLNKRRFVLAVVKKYVESHPDITYEALRQRFPDRLSNSPTHGVFRPYHDILNKLDSMPDLRKRFFLDEHDLITLSDGTKLTVYNQWGNHFPKFLEIAKEIHDIQSY